MAISSRLFPIIMDVEVFIILQLVLVLSLLLFFPDGTFAQTTTTTPESTTTNGISITQNGSNTSTPTTIIKVPTCAKLVEDEKFYFPNDCVKKCSEKQKANGGNGGEFDIDRSRNVNGKMKCYCVGDTTPICNDDPLCSDLSIYPGSADENCFNNVCSSSLGGNNNLTLTAEEKQGIVVVVTDEIEFANSPEAANKNQTHFKVSCSCDNGKTNQCGIDYILFSDLTYLPSCTAAYDTTEGKLNTLDINSQEECTLFCTTTQQQMTSSSPFVIGVYELSNNDNSRTSPQYSSCACFDDNSETDIAGGTASGGAVACDDTKANYNDGSGLGTKNCYEEVGVNKDIDCPPDDDVSSGTTTTVTAAAVAAAVAMIMIMMMV